MGRPQLGHEGATSETSLPQSGHLISATFTTSSMQQAYTVNNSKEPEAIRSPERCGRCGHSRSDGKFSGWAQNWAHSENHLFRRLSGITRSQLKGTRLDGATRRDRTGDLLIANQSPSRCPRVAFRARNEV